MMDGSQTVYGTGVMVITVKGLGDGVWGTDGTDVVVILVMRVKDG